MRGLLCGCLVVIAACLVARPAVAQSNATVDALLKRVQALEDTNKALTQRIEELEKKQDTVAPPAATPQSKEPSAPVPATPPSAAGQDTKPTESSAALQARWEDGLHFDSADDQFHLKVGGRVMFDAAHFTSPDYWILGGPDIDEHDGTQFRWLRLELSGEVYEDFLYKLETDFANSDVQILDAYVGMQNIPYAGTLRVGQFSEPLGLEALTSSSHITFMERSMATQALIPYRSRGAALNNAFFDQRLTASVGVFNGGIEQDSNWSVTGRLSGLPWYADDGRRLLHLGVAASHRNPESDYAFYARPGSHLADDHLNTGALPANEITLLGAEAALVFGPFSLQGEYVRADVSFKPEPRDVNILDIERYFRLGDRSFDGYYIQASYFMTGEHRPYDRANGYFDRVVPKHPFRLHGGGLGAWELAARYEKLTLDDYDVVGGVVGGNAHNVTAGVNWYMTSNFRLTLNYVRSTIDQYAYDGAIDIIEARVQADF